ncbi:MAG: hypothetical protein O7H39_11315, partial [Gammaproteobacteria bacterium]|nr:hypothetical protein [Gammaproteobacteria bacterium]
MPIPTDKRRERSAIVGWIISHPKTTLALCTLALLAAITGAVQTPVNRRLQRRIAAIRAKGEPITIDDINALRPVIPNDQNMTLSLIELGENLQPSREPKDLIEKLWYDPRAPTGEPLAAELLDAARRYLDEKAAELDGIHEALKLDQGCMNTVWPTPAFTTMLPGLGHLHMVARVLATEQQVAEEDGDQESAALILFEMLHLDDALKHEPSILGTLMRMATRWLALDRIERTVNRRGLHAESIRRLEQCLLRMECNINLRKIMMVERAFFLDTMEWIRASRANAAAIGGRVAGLSSIWSSLPVIPALDTLDTLEMFTDLVDCIDKPDVQSIECFRSIDSRISTVPWYRIMSFTLVPSFSRATDLWVRHVASTRALRTALACERYRLTTGDWPDNLSKLVPDFLSALPIDPFDGQTIRFERI